jgi:hypothetical protein
MSATMGTRSNRQGETQLLAEWLTRSAAGVPAKTHVFVGEQTLLWNGAAPSPNIQRALGVWSDWADCRLVYPSEVWLVEAKIVGTSCAYGQVLDYARQYAMSADYQPFYPRQIVAVVLTAYERPGTAAFYATFGVRTIVFTPTWASASLAYKIQGAGSDL